MNPRLAALALFACLGAGSALAEPSLVQVNPDPAYTQLDFRADGEVRSLNSCTIMLSRPVRELKTLPDLQQVRGFVHLSLRDVPMPPVARQALGKTPEIIFEIERMEPVGAEPKAAPKAAPKGKKAETPKPGVLLGGKMFDIHLVGSVHTGNVRYGVPPMRVTVAPSEAGLALQSKGAIPLKWSAWPTAQEASFTLFLPRE